MQILINHIGYAPAAMKRAIVKTDATEKLTGFSVISEETGITVISGTPVYSGAVDRWKDWTFWTIDFSALSTIGKFRLAVTSDKETCCATETMPFEVRPRVIRETISDILYYFSSQRCKDEWNEKDHAVPIYGEERRVDVHGGWYDASGDVSKYLSHLSYANYMNPQQTQLCVWSMFLAAEELTRKNAIEDDFGTGKLIKKLSDEALYGADFLVRMQDPSGAFYMTVFDQWTADIEKRMICEYQTQSGHRYTEWQCSYRQGAGMSIAALAIAARGPRDREFTRAEYLAKAIKGFEHAEEFGPKYCNDGKENIIDDYCALLAATELFATTKEDRFYKAAVKRAENLMGRFMSDANCKNWLKADADGKRSFYHGADAGLPILSLLAFERVVTDAGLKKRLIEAVQKIAEFELSVTNEVNNPFGYPRQYVTSVDGEKRTSFFIAQKNESGYWWQGENARLGSLAAAAHAAARHMNPELAAKLNAYAANCINWTLGMNPFNVCMLQGRGYNNATYEEGFPNAPGGMCNGITSGFKDEHDIDFNPTDPPEAVTGMHRWRWGEQWIPHSGWYILAVSLENS